MKVLIQDVTSGEYLAAGKTRTAIVGNAADFEFGLSAYYIAKREIIGAFQILFYLPESNFLLSVIQESGGAAPI